MNYYTTDQDFALEAGGSLPGITIGYHVYGKLNADRSNVVWVCHALTANSDVARWWPGVVGEQGSIRPEEYFIVCANILGSCYGSTGPVGAGRGIGEHGVGLERPGIGKDEPLYSRFPMITIRDMVKAHILLRKHLGIDEIHLLMGGSMGGYQALEWAVMEPEVIGRLFLIATSPTESAWGIAVHTAQRLAIEADETWREASPGAGQKGLKAARAIGILTYRNYGIMVQKQSDPDVEKLDGFRASSYIEYQGKKLVERFSAYSYWLLTKAMDSHNIARGRVPGTGRAERGGKGGDVEVGGRSGKMEVGGRSGKMEAGGRNGKMEAGGRSGDVETVLRGIRQKTLLIGITSDILCPFAEQRHMAEHLPDARLVEIDSAYGHDGFMVEGEKIANHLRDWLSAD